MSHLKVDTEKKIIQFPVVYHPDQFNDPMGKGLWNHHLVSIEGSRSAKSALFVTPVEFKEVCEALAGFGLKPGDDIPLTAWDNRKNLESRYPDSVTQGAELELSILGKETPIAIEKFVVDKNNFKHNFRFAGNMRNYEHWQLGCLICLQNCPGGAIVDSNYTIRQFFNQNFNFKKPKGNDLKGGEEFVITIKGT